MGTGIVSIGLILVGQETFSRVLLGIDEALWLGLFGVFGRRAAWQRDRWLEEGRTPAALTAVAGTAVIGARFALLGVDWLAAALLVVALVLWLGLVRPVLGHWRTPTVGVSFVLVVSTESLALLAALLAFERRVAWLAVAAAVPLVLGLVGYAFVVVRFDLRQLRTGRGDHWVAGGALAIATLACARLTEAAAKVGAGHAAHEAARDGSFALWVAAMVWLPVLLACEALSPRPGYDTRRWSTVFPVGMYAVCSIAVGEATGIGGPAAFGRVWIWVAVGVWAVVTAGMVRRGVALAS